MCRLKCLAGILLLFMSSALYAQETNTPLLKKCPVNTITFEQGLLNNETTCIITDALGFTWVSTAIGMQRYNGYNLEDINPMVGKDTVKIKSPAYFFNLHNGHLVISYKNGVLEFDPLTNVFSNVISLDHPTDAFFSIVPILETSEGIWCMQERKGIVVYDHSWHIKKVYPVIDAQVIDKIIRIDFVPTRMFVDANADYFFIRTGKHQLLKANTHTHRFTIFDHFPGDILGFDCNENSLYVSTGHGLYHYAIADEKLLNNFLFDKVTDQPVRFGPVSLIKGDRVIVGINTQLLEFDADLKKYKVFSKLNGQPILETGGTVNIYYDNFERIWLLTNDNIQRIQDREIPFAYFKYPLASNNFVRSLYFDEQSHQLLAGCLNGGLQLYDTLANPLWAKPLFNTEAKDVLGIEKLSAHNCLVITWGRGWYLLDPRKRSLTKFTDIRDKRYIAQLYNNTFTSNLQRLDDSTLLIASAVNIFRCIFNKTTMLSVRPLLPFFKSQESRITSFVFTRDKTLWVGSYNGTIYRMDKNGVVQSLHLPDNFTVRCLAEDANHHVWIGANAGLYVYSNDGRLLSSFFKRSGLLNDCIYALLPAAKGSSVFASTNMGLSDVSLSGSIKNYTKELGLQDNEFNTAAALQTVGGKYYFGGVSGITAFFPSGLKEIKNKPMLNIIRLVVNDSSYNSSAGTWRGDTINLKYNQNHLQIDFAAMGILNADKYLYKYRMLGFEKHWRSTNQPTGIRYILETGEYTLEMSCSNTLSGQVFTRQLAIIVRPPWWLTWWFLTIIGLSAIATLTLVVSFYNKRKYQKKLQDLLLKQSLQSQRERISRDLHDNLGAQANAIFYGTELLRKKNDHEQKLIDDLHDTAGDMLTVLRETLWAMKITEVEAADLWLRILNFTRKLGTYYTNVKMTISGEPPIGKAVNASLALNMILIVQEAINNALRHSDATVIAINSFTNNATWRVEISDDGKGFDLSAVSKKTESYGLENMAGRAKESRIAFEINSVPSHGTKVSLEVGLHKMESQFTTPIK